VQVNDSGFRANSYTTTNTLSAVIPFSPAEALAWRSAVEGTFFARVTVSPEAVGETGAGDYLLSISRNCFIGSLGENHPPVLTNLNISSSVNIGSNATVSGAIWEIDAGDSVKLRVNWGDGVTNLVESVEAGRVDFSLSHVYVTTTSTNYTV